MADLGSLLGAAGIGGAIGKAIVSLELSTTKYQAELEAAQAKTTAGANSMSKGFGSFGSVATGALTAVGAAAVAFGAFSVKAAIEANDAHLKLQNTFENNAALSDSSVEAFERQADSLRDLTGVDDEAIISGQALLGQFNLTGKQVLELTPLIVDLSEKMGIDLEAAAKAVGKATEGNTGSLARYIGKIEVGSTAAETFANIQEKLGRVQGFAAESAKAEPWKVLGAQFEEVAENVGQLLLPALQGLADLLIDFVAVLQFATGGLKDFDERVQEATLHVAHFELGIASWMERFGAHIPFIGEAVKAWDRYKLIQDAVTESTQRHIGVVERLSSFYREKFATALEGPVGTAVKDAIDDVKDFTITLEENAKQTKITREEFLHSSRVMEHGADQLNAAVKAIAKEDWINRDYVKFLSEQGPEWLIAFANSTEREQRKAQDAWEESTRKTNMANRSLEEIVGTLDKLDTSTTKHTVEVEYRYVGFDPSKPGMSGQQR